MIFEIYIAGMTLYLSWQLIEETRGHVELDVMTLVVAVLWPVFVVLLLLLLVVGLVMTLFRV